MAVGDSCLIDSMSKNSANESDCLHSNRASPSLEGLATTWQPDE